uniref:hypothetical protein n=1 Tax=[Ruminococcus] torques TaxID=33039 RepID=UPI00402AF1D7
MNNRKKFRLEDYKGNIVMHCNTEEKAKIFQIFLDRNGKSWGSGVNYLDQINWKMYKKDTCYLFNEGLFGELEDFKEENYKILEFDDFDWSNTECYKTAPIIVEQESTSIILTCPYCGYENAYCYDTVCEYFGQTCDWSMFKLICQECKELIMIEDVEWS